MSDRQRGLSDFFGSSFKKKESKRRRGPPRSRDDLVKRLRELKEVGWIQTRKQVNDGLVGNTLEDYLNIKENNLTLPDAGRYELKAQRMETSSMTTLFHFDPFPRRPKTVVTHTLGPIYGWPHEEIEGEWSFRITMYGNGYTNRGFRIVVDEKSDRLLVEFDPDKVDPSKENWLTKVLKKGGRNLVPQPYWPLIKIKKKVQKKISNIIYAHAESRKKGKFEEFKYDTAILHEGFDFERFKQGLANGGVLVDFDARTTHNHGTKFRLRKGTLEKFFARKEQIF